MKITIIGPGFVGLTSAVVYAGFGHQVIGIDIDQRKIDLLNQGVVSFYEPKLGEMVEDCLRAGNLSFTTDYKTGIAEADVIMICVGTPSDENGAVDLSFVEASLKSLAPYLKKNAIVVIKSTVPPGTLDWAKKTLDKLTKTQYYLASCPEFLKEGTAVDDTLYPDRIVIGATDEYVFNKLEALHQPLKAPIIKMRPASAQLCKYAANNYLAMRIAFVNEIANVCSRSGADVQEVIKGISYEKRIGDHYWYPGLGFGGSCFPKDVKGLAHFAQDLGLTDNLFAKVDQLNSQRPVMLLENFGNQIKGGWAGKKVAVLGLAFKPNTDDQRVSPALATIPFLLAQGCEVLAYDPMVKKIASKKIAEHACYRQVDSIEAAITEADVILALVEWPQIIGFKFKKLAGKQIKYFIDMRNQFSQAELEKVGFTYFGIGRGK